LFSTALVRRSASVLIWSWPSPTVEHGCDVRSHFRACLSTLEAGHQQLVIAGVLVADSRRDRQLDRLGLERAPAAERPTLPDPRTAA
jgi:hypothetical protein